MSGWKVLILVLVVGVAIVALCYDPGVRGAMSGCWQAAREDMKSDRETVDFGAQETVYVPRGDGYYHRQDCPALKGKIPVRMPLSKAREFLKPCPKCNPPH